MNARGPSRQYAGRQTIRDEAEGGTITCPGCVTAKPISDFYRRSDRQEYYRTPCKACLAAGAKRRKEAAKASDLEGWRQGRQHAARKTKYGISPEVYAAMLNEQGGVCAICRQPEMSIHHKTGTRASLFVDHNHTTNAVRGLVCSGCNSVLGYSKDSIVVLESAAAYLRKHGRV
jgi:hypothetical protein